MPNNKKFFDILPPEKIKEHETSSTNCETIALCSRTIAKQVSGSPLFRIFIILFLVIFISGGIIGSFVLNRAEIKISPRTEMIEFKEEITVSIEEENINLIDQIIPGEIFTYQKTFSQRFESSGKVHREIKAQGIIRVFNAFSTDSQILLVNTRFLTPDGVLFRSKERVIIPGAKKENGEIMPSYLDIKVRADQPGEIGNIPPSTFSIPGFRGTLRYIGFYGKSFYPMTGGFIGEVFQVQEKDLNRAQEELKKILKYKSKTALLAQTEGNFALLEELLKQEVISVKSSAQAGEIAEYFDFQAILFSEALMFNQQYIRTFAKDFIFTQIDENMRIDKENLKYDWTIKEANLEEGNIILELEFSVPIYHSIDKDYLKIALKDKSSEEVKMFFEDKQEIYKVQVDLWPFWITKIPVCPEKIKIYLELLPDR